MRSWLIVPNGSSLRLVATSDLAVRAVVDVPPTAVHALAADGSALAYAEGAHVTILGQLLGGSPRVEATFRAPAKVDALALRDDVVFVGSFGAEDPSSAGPQPTRPEGQWLDDTPAIGPSVPVALRPRLGLFDRAARTYAEVPLPTDAALPDKRIDWLALGRDTLVVVDDLVYPRKNLLFDVREQRAPRHLRTKAFEWNLLRSFVKGAADDGVTLAILEHHRHGQHVAIVRMADLRFHGGVAASPTAGVQRGERERVEASGVRAAPFDVCAVAIADSTLFLAAKGAGLGWVDLAPMLRLRTYTYEGTLIEDISPRNLEPESIRRVPVASGPVVGVVAVDARRAYAVIERDGGHHGVLIEL